MANAISTLLPREVRFMTGPETALTSDSGIDARRSTPNLGEKDRVVSILERDEKLEMELVYYQTAWGTPIGLINPDEVVVLPTKALNRRRFWARVLTAQRDRKDHEQKDYDRERVLKERKKSFDQNEVPLSPTDLLVVTKKEYPNSYVRGQVPLEGIGKGGEVTIFREIVGAEIRSDGVLVLKLTGLEHKTEPLGSYLATLAPGEHSIMFAGVGQRYRANGGSAHIQSEMRQALKNFSETQEYRNNRHLEFQAIVGSCEAGDVVTQIPTSREDSFRDDLPYPGYKYYAETHRPRGPRNWREPVRKSSVETVVFESDEKLRDFLSMGVVMPESFLASS